MTGSASSPHRHKIVIPGNQEFSSEADERRRSLLTNATVLINEGIDLEGLQIWGSPVNTSYSSAFGLRSPRDRARHWAKIPEDMLTSWSPMGHQMDFWIAHRGR